MHVPGMIEGTAYTPGGGQLNAGRTARAGEINTVGRRAKADALVAEAAASEHREVRRRGSGGDHIFCGAFGVARIELDVVTRAGRQVLDLQRRHHRATELRVG